MHCVHKKRFVCFRIIRWLLASLRIVLSRLMYLTVISPWSVSFTALISIYLQNITISAVTLIHFRYLCNEKMTKAFLWKLYEINTIFFLNPSPFLITSYSLQARNHLRANFSFMYLLELSFIHQEFSFRRPWKRPKTLACLRWFPQKGRES